jgi:hypothetical protein
LQKPFTAIIAGVAVVLMLILTATNSMPHVLGCPGPCSPPQIYYVSPLTRTSSTYFYIYGSNFEPFGIPLFSGGPANGGYSGQDWAYAACNGHPTLEIADLNQGWSAGGYHLSGSCGDVTVDGYTFSGYDRIGFVGLTWSDDKITLTGFGNALPNYYPYGYHIHNGDKLLVAVFTEFGTSYALIQYTGPSL